MNKHLQYLRYVAKHKWYTFKAARELGITWLGIIHDWTKFLPREWFAYANYFYGQRTMDDVPGDLVEIFAGQRDLVEQAFDVAWLHHQKSNKHHWQYWLLNQDIPEESFAFSDSGHHSEICLMNNNQATGISMAVWMYEEYREVVDMIFARLNCKPIILPMPDKYRREMLADWRGAGMAQNKPDTAAWYNSQRHNIILHPETREWVEKELKIT
jgi:hypothetical protein